jgi:ribosomal-protein-alanine N-acetyltransferase
MIRTATLEDISQICLIESECFGEDAWSRQNFLAVLANDISKLFVYEKDKEIIGYAVVTVIFDEAHLDNLAVSLENRKKGIGKQLVSYILRYLKDIEIHKITLEVRKSNTAAINLYKSLGFAIEGVRKNYYKNQEDAYIMWRYDGKKP